MSRLGIFFGTRSGTTRLMAKKMAKLIKAKYPTVEVAKPLNINRTDLNDLLTFDALIIGTPTYGEGILPGIESGQDEASWADVITQLKELDFSGRKMAIYGVGDQETHPAHFVDGLRTLYDLFEELGADLTGAWPVEGYTYTGSTAVEGDHFVGLAIDNASQGLLTDPRLEGWVEQVIPDLLPDAA